LFNFSERDGDFYFFNRYWPWVGNGGHNINIKFRLQKSVLLCCMR